MLVSVAWTSVHSRSTTTTTTPPPQGSSHAKAVDAAATVQQLERAVQRGGRTASSTSTVSKPDVLLMLVDDMGMNDVGYTSSDLRGVTPTIDALATEGVRLERYYTMQMCTPARSALLTGKYAFRLGMQMETIKPNSEWGLPTNEVTMGECFRANGYASHVVGKWNLGHATNAQLPTARGFDSFQGFLTDEIHYHNHTYPEAFCGDMSDGSYNCMFVRDFVHVSAQSEITLIDNSVYTNHLLLEHARSLIEERASSDSPLFLYFAAQNVHGPLDEVPDSWVSAEQEAALAHIALPHRLLFGRMLAALDKTVDELTGALRTAGLWNNTVIVFASDNGACHSQGGSNWPLRGGKHFMFEGGVRVPAFVWSWDIASSAVAGSSFTGLFHVTDWLPTLMAASNSTMAAAGANANQLSGVNQWSALLQQADAPRTELVLNVNSFTICCESTTSRTEVCTGDLTSCENVGLSSLARLEAHRAAIISGDWKLITSEYGQPWFNVTDGKATWKDAGGLTGGSASGSMDNCMETYGAGLETFLFNLAEDPTESNNLINNATEVVEGMQMLLKRHLEVESTSNWAAPVETPYSTWHTAGGFVVPWLNAAVGDSAGNLSGADPVEEGASPLQVDPETGVADPVPES